MRSYRGTGTATKIRQHGGYENSVVPFASIEAKDAASARKKALAEMEKQHPAADGYTHVVALEEVEGDE